jgi:2-polyprenyl-3-methyl-5-hydroxy-6-metoxy-1,4-benzoquinol methylase
MENAVRYHAEIDLSQKDTSQAQLIRLTGRNKDVLEVGPATGYVTKILQERGCRVSCIEIDPEAAEIAAPFTERMVVGNIETMDLPSTFAGNRFDVVTFGDVLEHLVDPLSVLIRVRDILTPRGYVVASVPNVAHGSIRLSLLAGHFDYLDQGLLDRTHLRFFTQETLGALFHDAGYDVKTWRRVLADPFATEVGLREADFPPYLVDAVRNAPEGHSYQFVLKAYPATSGSNGRKPVSDLEIAAQGPLATLWRLYHESNELRDNLAARNEELQQKEASLADTNAKLADREALLAAHERSLREMTAQLTSIYDSLGYKYLESFRRRTRKLFPPGSLRGAPYRFLARIAGRVARRDRAGRDAPPSTHA